MGFPGESNGKESACNAGHTGLIPGMGRSPGEGNSNPLSILAWRIPMDGEACQAAVYRVTKIQTRQRN